MLKLLPKELEHIVYSFINPKWLSNCKKKFYEDYFIENINDKYSRIYSKVPMISENFIRYLVRNDLHYPFNVLHSKRFNQWNKIKKWRYKKKKYKTYFNYLRDLCREYESGNCLKIINYKN